MRRRPPRPTLFPFCALFRSFFFNDTATTEIYTLSLHDALPISPLPQRRLQKRQRVAGPFAGFRSEEHTSELQSPCNLVCRLLLEKKNINRKHLASEWRPAKVAMTENPRDE